MDKHDLLIKAEELMERNPKTRRGLFNFVKAAKHFVGDVQLYFSKYEGKSNTPENRDVMCRTCKTEFVTASDSAGKCPKCGSPAMLYVVHRKPKKTATAYWEKEND